VEKKKKVIVVRVSDAMHAAIHDAAKKEDKGEAEVVRDALTKHLKKK
jgi:hypothetical protein